MSAPFADSVESWIKFERCSRTTLCLIDGLQVVYSVLGIRRCTLELQKPLLEGFRPQAP